MKKRSTILFLRRSAFRKGPRPSNFGVKGSEPVCLILPDFLAWARAFAARDAQMYILPGECGATKAKAASEANLHIFLLWCLTPPIDAPSLFLLQSSKSQSLHKFFYAVKDGHCLIEIIRPPRVHDMVSPLFFESLQLSNNSPIELKCCGLPGTSSLPVRYGVGLLVQC
jgi:hypothetical protein